MMTFLLVMLLFAVLQFAVFIYARNVVAASAAAAARYGANAGTDVDSAAAKATSLIDAGLGAGAARRFACSANSAPDPASGLRVVQVRCAGPVRMAVLPFAMPATVRASSSALKEGTS
jgi:Flp pilus assembly protein TadG